MTIGECEMRLEEKLSAEHLRVQVKTCGQYRVRSDVQLSKSGTSSLRRCEIVSLSPAVSSFSQT